MSKNKIVFFIGFVLIVMPLFLGFPTSWENFITVVFGIILIVLSFSAAAKRRASSRRTRRLRQMGSQTVEESDKPLNVTILSDVPERSDVKDNTQNNGQSQI